MDDLDENIPPATAGDTEELQAGSLRSADLYPLDWQTTEVSLFKGRFKHTLRRPTPEMLLKREEELQVEIPIAKDGSYALPDPTLGEETDAKYYDQIVESASGYPDDHVPELHKARAFQGLYHREVESDEDADLFADEIAVIDEVGSGVNPDYTIRHIMRPPSESELRTYRRKASSNSELRPGKRGRQFLVTRSTLKTAIEYYELWLIRIEGASVAGEPYSDSNRAEFIAAVDPLIKRKVVAELADMFSTKLSD